MQDRFQTEVDQLIADFEADATDVLENAKVLLGQMFKASNGDWESQDSLGSVLAIYLQSSDEAEASESHFKTLVHRAMCFPEFPWVIYSLAIVCAEMHHPWTRIAWLRVAQHYLKHPVSDRKAYHPADLAARCETKVLEASIQIKEWQAMPQAFTEVTFLADRETWESLLNIAYEFGHAELFEEHIRLEIVRDHEDTLWGGLGAGAIAIRDHYAQKEFSLVILQKAVSSLIDWCDNPMQDFTTNRLSMISRNPPQFPELLTWLAKWDYSDPGVMVRYSNLHGDYLLELTHLP